MGERGNYLCLAQKHIRSISSTTSALLESELNTSNFSVMPDKSIHLYDYVENAGKVSALLSANNITIYQLAQSGDSLETYYTNLIGGCQND